MKLLNMCLVVFCVSLASCNLRAVDAGLQDARDRILAAQSVTSVSFSKDSWFVKNIPDLPAGKEIAIKVKPDADQEFILVKAISDATKEGKKYEDCVILPITDGRCSVVTDKDTINKYRSLVAGKNDSGSTKAASSPGGSGSWKVKGKVIKTGMSREEVIKVLGDPNSEINSPDEHILMYSERIVSDLTSEAAGHAMAFVPFGSSAADSATRSARPNSYSWSIYLKGNVVSSVGKTTSK